MKKTAPTKAVGSTIDASQDGKTEVHVQHSRARTWGSRVGGITTALISSHAVPSFGGIHHPNITLAQAMVRYVIAPNRGRESNIRILGYRPVNDLPKVFPKAFPNGIKGEGTPRSSAAVCSKSSGAGYAPPRAVRRHLLHAVA
jgi:hypothetical protein